MCLAMAAGRNSMDGRDNDTVAEIHEILLAKLVYM
jgi:hypothetical protein